MVVSMDIKRHIIDRLESRKGLSPECDEFIEDAVLAIELTPDYLVIERYLATSLSQCLNRCLVGQTWIKQKYSKTFIERISCILLSENFVFVA